MTIIRVEDMGPHLVVTDNGNYLRYGPNMWLTNELHIVCQTASNILEEQFKQLELGF